MPHLIPFRTAALRPLLLVALGAALLAACGDDESTAVPTQGPLEIAGTYTDDFGTTHVITQDTWAQTATGFAATFHINEYSNAADDLLAQNDAANGFNPSLYSRFTWSTAAGSLYYCQDPFDAPTLADARAAPAPDATDPATGGCGGFAWSRLNP